MRSLAALCASLALAALPSLATATITQPNGLVVPRDSMNGEIQLYTMFSMRGESIDYQADAHATPAVFSPLCDFRATFVLKQSGSSFPVAWYNATGTPPTAADLHVIVPAGAPVGTVVTGANIRSDPAYLGGLVGFALVGGQVHYTEQQFNQLCTGCSPPAPWTMAVIYQSTVTPNAYYVAFEDGPVGPTPPEFNNDGDYNDDVYFFEGLVCSGGGQACDTGMPGICSTGLTTCNATGVTCQQTVQPSAERCNGLDDDCNGMTDDGNGLCPANEVCDHGACVPHCVEGGCFTGQVCNDVGLCVDSACASVTCPVGQVCTAGTCHGACDGVDCPGSQVCQGGRCVDPCAGVTCADGQVCDRGACRRSCTCLPCDTGLACDSASGSCMEPSCVGVTCDAGAVCRAGSCVDPCVSAHCPAGEMCTTGQCVAIPPMPDAGVHDAGSDASADAGSDASADAGSDAGSDASSDAGDAGGMDGGRDGGAPDGGSGGDTGGCGCSAPGHAGRGLAGAWAIALGAMLARRRRRGAGVRG